MTSQYRHRRSSNPNTNFTALEPGEIAVNTANRQLMVGDADSATIGTAIPLLGVRYFDARAVYAVNEYVVYAGNLYRAKVAITTPAAFTPVQWDLIAGQQQGPFVAKSGDTMTGHLSLPPGPNSGQAVRKDYVDGALAPYATQTFVTSALAPYATTSYVNTQDVKAVLKTGSVMTGPLVLPGDPTNGLEAASKAYVDATVLTGPGVPAGAVMDFAMVAAPTGWLVCDGQQVSRTTYAALYAAVGNTWGAGDGSTTFNLPNFASRYRRHREASGLAGPVGTYQNPCNLTHYHGVNITSGYVSSDHQHYVSGTTGAADRSLNHSHGGVATGQNTWSGSVVPTGGAPGYIGGFSGRTATEGGVDHLHSFSAWTGGINANHQHTVTGNTGGGSADDANEARPYSATVLTCIKT